MTFKLIRALLLAVTIVTLNSQSEADEMDSEVRTIVILHTNDLHGHLTGWTGWEGDLRGKTIGGLDRLAGAIAQMRQESGHEVLLVDAGDLIGEARKRDEESPIDSLFADILRAATNADIALLPGVGYGVAIPPGPITAAQLRQMVPHEGKVVTMRLSGAQVREVLEQAVENTFSDDPAVKVGGMLQVSGMKFSYDPNRAKGARVWFIERNEGEWDATTEYVVVTNSMLAQGGHNYQTLTKGDQQKEHDSQYEIIRRWFRENSPMVTPPLGRIRQAIESNP